MAKILLDESPRHDYDCPFCRDGRCSLKDTDSEFPECSCIYTYEDREYPEFDGFDFGRCNYCTSLEEMHE